MTAAARNVTPQIAFLADRDLWLFYGDKIDAFVATNPETAKEFAAELNSDECRYSVLRFNAEDGTCRPVTDEFLPAEADADEWTATEFDREASAADQNHQFAMEQF